MKAKQTISIDTELLKEAKHIAIDKQLSLSMYIQKAVYEQIQKDRGYTV